MTADSFIEELNKHADDYRAVFSKRFFKCGPGEYGEGDEFIGVRVPDTRKVCKLFRDMSLVEVQKLLDSPIHEHRLAGAIILADKYPKVSETEKQKIFDMYIKNVAENKINNWDIVDVTCEYIVGAHLEKTDKKLLLDLARSDNLWARRVSVISTFAYIKKGEPGITIEVAGILLFDRHDLIQKAVGWMLREVGKRCDEEVLTDFLDKHAREMPRTMLRYAIEKLPEEHRLYYLKLK